MTSTMTALRIETQSMPTVPPNNLPGSLFRWRSAGGDFHLIHQMETRHLFFTVKMIWNHSMPLEARSQAYRSYHFGPFYTNDYMLRALAAMCPELLNRPDLTSEHWAEIERWRDYFRRRPALRSPFRGEFQSAIVCSS